MLDSDMDVNQIFFRRTHNVVTSVSQGLLEYKMDCTSPLQQPIDSGGCVGGDTIMHESALSPLSRTLHSHRPVIITREGVPYLAGVNSGSAEANECDCGTTAQYARASYYYESFIIPAIGSSEHYSDFPIRVAKRILFAKRVLRGGRGGGGGRSWGSSKTNSWGSSKTKSWGSSKTKSSGSTFSSGSSKIKSSGSTFSSGSSQTNSRGSIFSSGKSKTKSRGFFKLPRSRPRSRPFYRRGPKSTKTPFEGWNCGEITTCGQFGQVCGGYNVKGAGSELTKTFDLPPGMYSVELDFIKIDSWFVCMVGSGVRTQTEYWSCVRT